MEMTTHQTTATTYEYKTFRWNEDTQKMELQPVYTTDDWNIDTEYYYDGTKWVVKATTKPTTKATCGDGFTVFTETVTAHTSVGASWYDPFVYRNNKGDICMYKTDNILIAAAAAVIVICHIIGLVAFLRRGKK